MEVDFNPARVPAAGSSQPPARQDAAAATDAASFDVTAALQDKLKNLQAIRPEKIDLAKSLISDPTYPPDDVLDRIAVLLATRLKS